MFTLTHRTGIRYAECDVWCTSDNQIVLSHNNTFGDHVDDEESEMKKVLIRDLEWSQVAQMKLKDGCSPVLLSTVLEDLKGTRTTLAVEIKDHFVAIPLAQMLHTQADLRSSVGFVMSFNFESLEQFSQEFDRLGRIPREFPIAWLVDNPSVSYPTDTLDAGEKTFNPSKEPLLTFLSRLGLVDRMRATRAGLYLQYNPTLTPVHITEVKSHLMELLQCIATEAFVGLWSDIGIDPTFDTVQSLRQWTQVCSAVNTDLPPNFFISETSKTL